MSAVNPQVFNYAVFPSIVPADKESSVVIHPLGENTKFLQGVTYTVEVRGAENFCCNYATLPVSLYNLTPNSDGDLVLHHHFEGEQRHSIRLVRPEEDLNATPHRNITNHSKYGEN